MDQLRERFADLAAGVASGLPEPTDEEVRGMMAAARLALNRNTPNALAVICLGALVLRLRPARLIVDRYRPNRA